MTHTPGPWRFEAPINEDGEVEIISSEPVEYFYICGVAGGLGESEANANLIAAAPELLEAAEDFVAKVDRGEARSKRSYAMFKAAIAKAKGGQA